MNGVPNKAILWVCVLLSLIAGAGNWTAKSQERSETIINSEYLQEGGWDKGELTFDLPKSLGEGGITFQFSGGRGKPLTHALIKTGAWTVDLTGYVSHLAIPYPNRVSLIRRGTANSGLTGLGVKVPFRESATGRCLNQTISILGGRVVASNAFDDQEGRCAP